MIQFENVAKKYPSGNYALQETSLSIDDNEFAFLVGHSGAGKTTILKLILRDILPSQGSVFVDERDITSKKFKEIDKLRRAIGVVFQDFKILPDKTVFENIALSLQVAKEPTHLMRDSVAEVLELVGLTKKKLMFPMQLSAGELQRVAIARAIVGGRKIILADEPTGNLDPKTSWEIMKIFKKLAGDRTLIIATHNVDIVNSFKKRVITLSDGKIVSDKRGSGYSI